MLRLAVFSFLSLISLISTAEPQRFVAGLADPAFRDCIATLASKRGWQNATDVREIKCHNKQIQSVKGIAAFTNATKISLYKNRITEFDAGAFPKLISLNIAGNQLTSLHIAGMASLEVVYVFHNQLTNMSLRNSQKLNTLKANNNQLINATLSGLPALKKVYLFDNNLEILDAAALTAFTELSYLDVRHNPMPDDFYDFLDTIAGLTALHDGNAEDWD